MIFPTVASADHDPEGGFTLVDSLVTIVIMGLAIAALLGGLGAAVIVSDQHRQQAVAGSAVRSFAEAVAAAPYNATCPTTIDYAAGYTSPAGYTSTVTSIKYFNPTTRAFDVTTCPSPDPGAQKVSLRVASNRGGATETIDVIVRKATA